MPHTHGKFRDCMNIAKHAAILIPPPSDAPRVDLPSQFIARLGVGGFAPFSQTTRSRETHSPAEVLIDAVSVCVSIQDGILHIVPAPRVTALNLNIEECSDGAILISDDIGYACGSSLPELRESFERIHITAGVDGDDNLVLDIPSSSRLRGAIRVFSAFGDDITAISAFLFNKSRNRTMSRGH
ncbi:MAG: hypothetical protein RL088_483 [Verrucomicrobiota bacterium]|jgi:hypothetical protein